MFDTDTDIILRLTVRMTVADDTDTDDDYISQQCHHLALQDTGFSVQNYAENCYIEKRIHI